MWDSLFERGLFAATAAVLVVPELATFFVLTGFAVALAALLARFAWAVLTDSAPELLPTGVESAAGDPATT